MPLENETLGSEELGLGMCGLILHPVSMVSWDSYRSIDSLGKALSCSLLFCHQRQLLRREWERREYLVLWVNLQEMEVPDAHLHNSYPYLSLMCRV